jgi:hypothetical protein
MDIIVYVLINAVELFRCLLFFVNEQLVEDPQPDTPLQVACHNITK